MFDMKKTFLMLTILALAAPCMAAVSIDVNDLGNGWAAIEYTADSNVSAFGLKVTVGQNRTITNIQNYHVGESNSTAKGYGIFLGKIGIAGGVPTSYGDPIAPNTDPGASGTGLDTNTVILELGALYEDGNQPPRSGTLCVLRVSGCCKMSVAGEATRCGEVGEDAAGAVLEGGSTSVVIDDTNCTDVQIDYSCGCACWFDTTSTSYLVPDGTVDTLDFGVLLGDLNYAMYLVGVYEIVENDPCTGFLYRECNDASGPTYIVPDGKINTTDFNVLVGRLNYAMYEHGVYSYPCGDPNIDPPIYY
jgi:hypothetical protein